MQIGNTILAFDVGEQRIGVARASLASRLAAPLTTLKRDDHIMENIHKLALEHDAGAIVVGLPRGLKGQITSQTTATEQFAAELKKTINLPLFWQDEALTSQKAESELFKRRKAFLKDDVDALAATYILEDFLEEHSKEFIA